MREHHALGQARGPARVGQGDQVRRGPMATSGGGRHAASSAERRWPLPPHRRRRSRRTPACGPPPAPSPGRRATVNEAPGAGSPASCCASSSAVKSGFTVVTIAPSRAAPWNATGYSSTFGLIDPEDVPLPVATRGQAGAGAPMVACEAGVGHPAIRDRVHERGAPGELGRPFQDVSGDGDAGDVDGGTWARMMPLLVDVDQTPCRMTGRTAGPPRVGGAGAAAATGARGRRPRISSSLARITRARAGGPRAAARRRRSSSACARCAARPRASSHPR